MFLAAKATYQMQGKLNCYLFSDIIIGLNPNLERNPISANATNKNVLVIDFDSYSQIFMPPHYPGGVIRLVTREHSVWV